MGKGGERSKGVTENVIMNNDPPIKSNSYSILIGGMIVCLSHKVEREAFMVHVFRNGRHATIHARHA